MKRLLLTSKGLANEAIKKTLLQILPVSPVHQTVAIITTAATNLKGKHPHFIEVKNQFHTMDFRAVTLIDVETDDVSQLNCYDVLYIGGGNPFYLLEQLRNSGADEIIKHKVENGGVVVGVSAGALVLGPHLEIVQHFTPELRNSTKLENSLALALFSFPIMPHYDREDVFPGEATIEERLQIFEKSFNVSVKRLKDNEALLLKDEEIIKIS